MRKLTAKRTIKGEHLTKRLEEFKGAVMESLKNSSHLQRSLNHEHCIGKYSLKTLVRAQTSMLLELHVNLETLDKEGEALSTKSSPEHDLRNENELAGLTNLSAELTQNLERLKYCEKRLLSKESKDLMQNRQVRKPSVKQKSLSPDKVPQRLRPVKVTRQLPSVSFDSTVVPKLALPKGSSVSFHQEFMQKAPEFSESWRRQMALQNR
mmetsp:Transcript_19594/g.35993  ORF Transcript_19594/g.35993 Transcript_19594/m.35993 type:complete len:209 (-) Transcript_19594:169-795(-)